MTYEQGINTLSINAQTLVHSNSNQRTLDAYNENAQEYIRKTFPTVGQYQPEMRQWIDKSLQNIKAGSAIFEIGSATLRDATYMRQKGYGVLCSDATINFVSHLRKQGEEAIFFNILESNFRDQYDMIFANGVFPHFTTEETQIALTNIRDGLSSNGIFSFSLKYGTGETWIDEKIDEKRFTHFWRREDIFEVLEQNGFEVIFSNSNTGAYPSHRWLNIVSRKKY